MPIDAGAAQEFAAELRRLRARGERPLYPAFRALVSSGYPDGYLVDSELAAPGANVPDLTVSRGMRLANWVEVKAPETSIEPLPAADFERFEIYRLALPHIVLTNGWTWLLFEAGTVSRRIELPQEWLLGQTELSNAELSELQQFFDAISILQPATATTYEEAVRLLATSARLIHAAVTDLSDNPPEVLQQARRSFTELLRTNPADPSELELADFADALAQTCTFGYLLARVEAGQDISPMSALDALSSVEHPFLKSAMHAVISPDPALEAGLRGVLRIACDAVNAAADVLAGPAGTWDAVPYVYEHFFAAYRPQDRFRYGVFYTPPQITRFQVREIRRKLQQLFGLTGVLDPRVVYLDPACGTGTYLLALAEEALNEAQSLGLPASQALMELFSSRVFGFEVSPGPASVAQARLTAWLRVNGVSLGTRFPVYVVNTLSPPAVGGIHRGEGNLWADNISQEQAAGDVVKRERPILVIMGNPPWGDRPRETFDVGPRTSQNLIADWAEGAAGAVINLYDLYVAFWRFALSMLLERSDLQSAEGLISYVTNRSWLRGKAYSGMRSWVRSRRAAADIVDLGGDVRAGARRDDEGVFAIMAGCAIATLGFADEARVPQSTVNYRRLRGTRSEKLQALEDSAMPESRIVAGANGDPFGPVDWGPLSEAFPLSEIFARNFPGVKTHRDNLVVDVTREGLMAKLGAWNSQPEEQRQAGFHVTSDRRLPRPGYSIDARLVIRHRYRPLDDRFLYGDRNFINRPGRISPYYENGRQTVALVCMDSRSSGGPAVIATKNLPGYNSFRGSYETHIFPLEGLGLLHADEVLSPSALRWASDLTATARDVGAYVLALANAPLYWATFGEAMEAEMVRFPLTLDQGLFREATAVGSTILSAWVLEAEELGAWTESRSGVSLGRACAESGRLIFENGHVLDGIHARTSSFVVSGYPVMQRFLEAREGVAFTLEVAQQIRRVAGSIAAILEAEPECERILAAVIEGPMVPLPAAV